jgi:hypothetical protein
MNAAGSPPTRSQRPSQVREQRWDIALGHPRRDDPLVTLDRLGIAADALWMVKRSPLSDVAARPSLTCRSPADLVTAGPRSNKIRRDGDQILKPVVGIFPQIPHNDLSWLRRRLRQKSNLADASNL